MFEGISIGDVFLRIRADTDEINTQLRQFSSDVEKNFGAILSAGRQIGMGLTAVGAGIVGGLGMAVKTTGEFGDKMAEVNSLGVKDLGKLKDGVKDVAASMGIDLVDSASAVYEALSAGISEDNAISFISNAAVAAQAGVTSLTTSVDLGTSVMNAFGKSVKDMNEIYGETFIAVNLGKTKFEELADSVGRVAPTFSAAGLSSKEMFSAIAGITTQGIATNEAVTGLKAAISNILKPTKDATDTAEALGIEFNSTALRSKGLAAFLEDLKVKTGGNVDALSALFGSMEAYNTIAVLTGNGASIFKKTLDEMENSATSTATAFKKMVDESPSFAWKQLRSEMQALADDIGTAILPTLKTFVDWIKPIVTEVRDWIKANPELFQTLVVVTGAIGVLSTTIGAFLIVLPSIVSGIGLVSTALSFLWANPIGLVIGGIAALIFAGYELIKHWDTVKEVAKNTWTAIAETVLAIWEGLKEALRGSFERLGEVVGAGFKWIVQLVTDPQAAIKEAWESIVAIFEWAWQKLKAIGELIWTVVSAPFKAVIGLIKELWSAFTGGFSQGFNGGEIPAHASGTNYAPGGLSMLAEEGPELVMNSGFYNVPRGSRVLNARDTANLISQNSSSQVTNNFNISSLVIREEADIKKVAQEFYQMTLRTNRARGI